LGPDLNQKNVPKIILGAKCFDALIDYAEISRLPLLKLLNSPKRWHADILLRIQDHVTFFVFSET
jgi:hypothetical protein